MEELLLRHHSQFQNGVCYNYYFNCDYAGDVVVTAQWIPNTYSLTIDANGGRFIDASAAYFSEPFVTSFTYDSGKQLFVETGYRPSSNADTWRGMDNRNVNGEYIPYREGYTFNGWKITSGGGTTITTPFTVSKRCLL